MTIPASRFVLSNERLYDSNNGPEGGFVVTYSGTARRHPWPARSSEFVMDGRGTAAFDTGDLYEGEVRFGMFCGEGKMKYSNGTAYDGEWNDNLPHGFGVLKDSRTGSVFLGMFCKGDRHGSGEETFPDGTYFSGLFKFGYRSGPGILRIGSTGDVVHGIYAKGRLHGTATVQYGNGDMFIGQFRRGKSHGEGRYTQCDSGDTYIELFHHGRCVEGVLDDNEDPVGSIGHGAEEEEETASDIDDRRSHSPAPMRKKLCRVIYAKSKDEYVGGWQREGSGGNRRGVATGRGMYREHATGIVYQGEFHNDLKEGTGMLEFPCSFAAPSPHDEPAGGCEGTENTSAEHHSYDELGFFKMPLATCVVHRYFVNPDDYPEIHHPDGISSVQGDFHLGMLDGRATISTREGGTIEGFFSKGLPHGIFHEHRPSDRQKFKGEVRSYYFHHGEKREPNFHQRAEGDGT
jgi:hypothetical protein